MTRRSTPSIVANPILVGAVTVLVTVVAVFLAYNANSGLPFVPTYELRVVLPNAARLVPGNEVRIGGARAGQIRSIAPQVDRDGTVRAVVDVQLEQRYAPLPQDSSAAVRQRSSLGLKYLELTPGTSRRSLPQGASWTPRAAGVVELDDALETFDPATRRAARGAIGGLSGGLAGRGAQLNRTLAALPPLMEELRPVMAMLAAPETDLRGFVAGAGSATATLRPVAEALAAMLDGGGRTLRALRAEREALGKAIDLASPTERGAARAFAVSRPFLIDADRLVDRLRAPVDALPRQSVAIADGLRAGTPVLRRVPPLAGRLERTLGEVERLARDPATGGSLRKLTTTVEVLRPTLDYTLPFQTLCNYLGVWFRNLNSATSEGGRSGHWFRFSAVVNPGLELQTDRPSPDLHVNPYPDQGQNGECEAGNEPYLPGAVVGAVPGRQPARTELTSRPEGVPEGP